MLQEEIYARPITREVNPAVVATDFKDKTVQIEIDEYVFTDEIINGLYRVLDAIRNGGVNHNGIWVNGYYGSGKSHFMKYLGYCLNKRYQEHALTRMHEAVLENDMLGNQSVFSIEVTVAESQDLIDWLKHSEVEIVMLNLGATHNTNAEQKSVFTEILWNQFNELRGMNGFNLALAQYLEKPLIEKNLFDQFKQALEEEQGYNWETDAAEVAIMELDTVLEIYHRVMPSVTIDAVRNAILNNQVDISPVNFCAELNKHLQKKGDNYRLVFMLDEVSQFIDNRRWLLLQLQEIVTGMHTSCGNRAWLMCTAQQTLNDVIDNVNGAQDDFGKIMGRFEVRVSLKGAQTEYITQQRLLCKNDRGMGELGALYDHKHSSIESQFVLPASYTAYADKTNFIDFYPFVPYQFRLIMQVFDSLVNHGYVDEQVKGNERSILKVTHNTAKNARGEEVGKLIAFDRFFNAMFEGELTHRGQHAIKNANEMIKTYCDGDPAFGKRVVNLLFMICNLSQNDQLLFPATLDNILTLMLEDVDAQKATLRQEIEKVLSFLYSKHILRIEKINNLEVYQFQSEDEIEAAQLVESKQVDNSDMAEQIRNIITQIYGNSLSNQETYCTRSFKVCLNIYGRTFLTQNNADITIDVVMESQTDNLQEYALNNDQSRMLLFIAPLLKRDRKLRQAFNWYCKVQKFMQDPANSAEREKTRRLFAENARKRYIDEIIPTFTKMFNECEIASGNYLIPSATLSGKTGVPRYKEAVQIHLGNIYTNAKQVIGDYVPKTTDELKRKILRPINPGEYGELNPLTPAEMSVDTMLRNKTGMSAIIVADIVHDLARKPYGWSENAAVYVLNELSRRNMWTFKYMNQSTNPQTIAANITSEMNKFSIVQATQVSGDVINAFISAWNEVFNNGIPLTATYDINQLLRECRDNDDAHLRQLAQNYSEDYAVLQEYSFAAPLKQAYDVFRTLLAEKETLPFLQAFISSKNANKVLLDTCKRIREFRDQQFDRYKQIIKFVNENQDNYDFLDSEDDKAAINQLRAIVSDTAPMGNMPVYIRLHRLIDGKLNELIALFRNNVKTEYKKTFEQLRTLAQQYHLSATVLPDEEAQVVMKTQSRNLYTLKDAADTANFYTTWATKLYDMAQANGNEARPMAVSRILRASSLATATPLRSEADIDAYLQTLRAKLLDSLRESGKNGQVEIKN